VAPDYQSRLNEDDDSRRPRECGFDRAASQCLEAMASRSQDPHWTGFPAHGLRSGYLTEAANRGVPLQAAMQQSLYKSVA